jgi:hypothetical protein
MPTIVLLLTELRAHHPRPLGLSATLLLALFLFLSFPGSVLT